MPAEEKSKEKYEEFKKKSKEACQNFVNTILSKIPDDVLEHLGNSKKEILLALKSMIDEEIKRTEDDVKKAKDTKVKS
ncbi:MAG: hypothetical protein A3C43_07350 [Candidatus Schekmanbacteria bacterium RIFCSPHIGHO2_02_FULL_38_11]|uniref:Uncharacterized protein n=1 Tax=Candidatus Schekmanbacteria bacterium RIFCSPLOWO2_12_FULL_38_15 TaxID=1817883 RepID=A0A1F7SMT5_9BACT|nr:MAG: hypothetical protein A2043_07035 [Candidatus Schekmanbacteria bacterium GWA2_38_9]OGL47991.1 MAG: hypothetical protein A3H37_08175 [Candidatus Schekmanbacteria bacterium RIFCSPLOWO2_02_FULL_38_14]OGL48429.1 MAG: hypothetical protein A3C43_07350 [Candidatus Schekmanbacteria bacterium RIFCSPHIGHO2_02_FULL_38_11]OGL54524.1 MAG: hypothetical protein A3G31_10215 [Candidatus Schekmanbacteria bacterium RIFCSPLOWO2_12_FULL_38_15]